MATYAITGGTGTLGTALTKCLLNRGHKVRAIARGESAHLKLQQAVGPNPSYSPLIGDVRDLPRMMRALTDVDYVIHAAAAKVIPLVAYNPADGIKTNILGTMNVVDACLDRGVKKAVFISSDKATAPSTLYGAQKLCSEHLWLASNKYCGAHGGIFRAVRYGNVWGSMGSILHVFQHMRETGELTITDDRCTRFHLRLDAAVELVLSAFDVPAGGLVIPKLPSYRVVDVADVIAPKTTRRIIGLRANEKIHESMISENESPYAVEEDDRYILDFSGPAKGARFDYNSGSNTWRVSKDEIRQDYERWYKER